MKKGITVILLTVLLTGCRSGTFRLADSVRTAESKAAEAAGETAERGETAPTGRRETGQTEHRNVVRVLAFGQEEPGCTHGAVYDIRCLDCGEYIGSTYKEALGHEGDTGIVTCCPDCTGEGSIRYTCVRCGTEWIEAYGAVQPHVWETISGTRWEQVISPEGIPSVAEVPWSYERCSACGERKD